MRSVVSTLQKAISAFDSIKASIENKGVIVGNKSVSEYAVCIDAIQTGSSNLQDKVVSADTVEKVVTCDNGYDGLHSVTVSAVNASIDANIVSNNIKKDVTILGVTGTYEAGGSPVLEEIQIQPSLNEQNITASAGYDGIGSVHVNPVTSEIDSDIIPENIKAGVEILGVLGSYAGGINRNPTKLNYLYSNSDILNITDFNSINTTEVTEMKYCFAECILTSINISSWDFSKCTNETYMFSNCSNLETVALPENINLKIATNMFNGCSKLKRIEGSIIIDGTSTSNMFKGCSLLEHVVIKSFAANNSTNTVTLDLSASSVLNVETLVNGLDNYTGGKTRIIKVASGLASATLVSAAAAKGYTLQ